MKRNLLVLIVVGLAVAFMLFSAKHRSQSVGASGPLTSTGGAGDKLAPNFKLVDISTGKTVQLSDFRGKAVLLNFWATWCPPCKGEIPAFIDLQNQYGPQGLQVIGVAMDDAGKEAISKFASEMHINYLVLQGTEQVAEAYGGVEALPTTFYIDRDGNIVDHVLGPVVHRDAEESIKRALNSGMSQRNVAGSTVSQENSSVAQTASSRSQ